MLTRRGAVPVKTSSGNNVIENTRKSKKLVPVLVPNFGEIPKFQYCTGSLSGSD